MIRDAERVSNLARERALIDAMATRYEWPMTDGTPALQQTYADAMAKVAAAYPDDADVHAVHAEAGSWGRCA